MNRTRIIAVLAAMLLLAPAAWAQKPAAKKRKADEVKLGTLAPKGSSFEKILQEMGTKWRDAGVTLTIYAGTMSDEPTMLKRMRFNQLQAGLFTGGGLAEIDASVEALQSMPMMFRSLEEVDYVREKLHAEIDKKLEAEGFIVLFWADAGWVRFFATDPVVHPNDLKKLHLFVTAGNNKQEDIMKAAGYKPRPLSPTDILTSLQTGLIDAVPSVPYIALTGQFYGKAKHMLEINWAPLVGGLVLTKKKWDSFPPATQQALREAAREAGAKMKRDIRAQNDKAVETMKKNKLVVHAMTPALEAEWRKAAEAAYPAIRGKMVPAEYFDKVQKLLADYRAGKK